MLLPYAQCDSHYQFGAFDVRSEARGIKGYQAIDLHTSVSARNMGFVNRYQ